MKLPAEGSWTKWENVAGLAIIVIMFGVLISPFVIFVVERAN